MDASNLHHSFFKDLEEALLSEIKFRIGSYKQGKIPKLDSLLIWQYLRKNTTYQKQYDLGSMAEHNPSPFFQLSITNDCEEEYSHIEYQGVLRDSWSLNCTPPDYKEVSPREITFTIKPVEKCFDLFDLSDSQSAEELRNEVLPTLVNPILNGIGDLKNNRLGIILNPYINEKVLIKAIKEEVRRLIPSGFFIQANKKQHLVENAVLAYIIQDLKITNWLEINSVFRELLSLPKAYVDLTKKQIDLRIKTFETYAMNSPYCFFGQVSPNTKD